MDSCRSIIIYRDDLLSASETFILSQGESLRRFKPFYVGTRSVPALSVPGDRQIILREDGFFGKASNIRHLFMGPSPSELRQLRGLMPCLLHAHFGPDGTIAMPIAYKIGIPLVVTFHGYDINMTPASLIASDRKLALYLFRREALKNAAACFIAVSQFIRQKLIAKGFPEQKIVVHHIGVDTDLFCADPHVQRKDIALFVGRLVENKGCEYFLRAMRTVQAIHANVEVTVIGDGPLRAQLQELARELNLRKCTFLGSQPPEKVRTWMNSARVFCVPSVEIASGASEGFGLVFSEAQSMGLPVVSFNTGGIPEAVEDGKTGFLVQQRDVQALTEKLLTVLRDKGLWMRFSEAARQRVKTFFDLRKQTALLEQIYDQILRPSGPTGSTAPMSNVDMSMWSTPNA